MNLGFGLVSGSLSLENRLLARVVEKLVAMPQMSREEDGLLRFSDGEKVFYVKTVWGPADEERDTVTILDRDKEPLFHASVHIAGFPSSQDYHPFCELIALCRGEKLPATVMFTLDLLRKIG